MRYLPVVTLRRKVWYQLISTFLLVRENKVKLERTNSDESQSSGEGLTANFNVEVQREVNNDAIL